MTLESCRVARPVAFKETWQTKYVEIGVGKILPGFLDDADESAIRCVHARVVLLPLLQEDIGSLTLFWRAGSSSLDQGKGSLEITDDAHLVAILYAVANTA